MCVKVDDVDCYFIKNKYGKAWEAFKTAKSVNDKLFNDYQKFAYKSITDDNKIYYADINKKQELYCTIQSHSVVVDPWRKFTTMDNTIKVIHYGNTRHV